MGECRTSVAKIPAATNGIALGLCGLAGLWAKMGAIHQWKVDGIVIFLLVVASLLYVGYVPIKIASCFSVFKDEMMQPPVVAAIASVPMMTMQIGSNICVRADAGIGNLFVLTGAVLQFLCMLHFFTLVFRQQAKLEPYWFPPTVSIAVTALAGKSCGWEPPIFQTCFYVAVLIMVALLPIIFFRVHRHPNEVALGPACNMLCAPASLNSLVWHSVDQPRWLGISLFVLALCVWCSTLVGLFLRRGYWVNYPFSPAWAAFTFPTASTSQAILFAYQAFLPDNWIAAVSHWIIFVGCNVIIVFVVVNFIWRLPTWLCGASSIRDRATTIDANESAIGLEADESIPVVSGYEIVFPGRRRCQSISVGALQRGRPPTTEHTARILTQRDQEGVMADERPNSISVGALQRGLPPTTEHAARSALAQRDQEGVTADVCSSSAITDAAARQE